MRTRGSQRTKDSIGGEGNDVSNGFVWLTSRNVTLGFSLTHARWCGSFLFSFSLQLLGMFACVLACMFMFACIWTYVSRVCV